jgi:Glycosyl transferase family 2
LPPRVDIYAFCRNEERFLPYFFRHYLTFARHIYIADNESTDRSLEIIRSQPRTTVVSCSTENEFRDETQSAFKNTAWKPQRRHTDWVFCVDIDEIVWHADMLNFLATCDADKIAIVKPRGFQMVSETFPSTSDQVYDQINRGQASELYSKPVIFSPRRVEEMNFGPGAHAAEPITDGKILSDSSARLLHYHYLGLDYILPRYVEKGKRLGATNRMNGWGYHYLWTPARIKAEFDAVSASAETLTF